MQFVDNSYSFIIIIWLFSIIHNAYMCIIFLTNAVFDGRIECVNDGWATVGDPVGFVDGFPELAEEKFGSE